VAYEWLTGQTDLQYACIFPLTAPKDCNLAVGASCECRFAGSTGYTANNPLCQDGTSYSPVQKYAKAYPGTRELQVLKDLGPQSVVASICPKSITPGTANSAHGYSAAMSALVGRLGSVLPPK
jgi:hypothetical protein